MSGIMARRRCGPHRSSGGGCDGTGPVLATPYDDNFDCGSTIDTTGSRFAGATPWTLPSYFTPPAAFAVAGGTLSITSSTNGPRGAVMATPSGNFRFETKLIAPTVNVVYAAGGIMLQESATGKMLLFGVGNDGGGYAYQVRRFTNSATWTTNYFGGDPAVSGQDVWLDVARSGSNLVFRESTDGSTWVTVATVAQTVDFTTAPDTVGLWSWERSVGGGHVQVDVFEYFHKTA